MRYVAGVLMLLFALLLVFCAVGSAPMHAVMLVVTGGMCGISVPFIFREKSPGLIALGIVGALVVGGYFLVFVGGSERVTSVVALLVALAALPVCLKSRQSIGPSIEEKQQKGGHAVRIRSRPGGRIWAMCCAVLLGCCRPSDGAMDGGSEVGGDAVSKRYDSVARAVENKAAAEGLDLSKSAKRVAVVPFRAKREIADVAAYGSGFAWCIGEALSPAGFVPVTAEELVNVMQGMDVTAQDIKTVGDLKTVGKAALARVVAGGTIDLGPDEIEIVLLLLDVRSGARLLAKKYTGQSADPFTLQDRIVADMIVALKGAKQVEKQRTAGVRKGDTESGARALFRAHDALTSGLFDRAISLANEALASSPNLAEAHLLKGKALLLRDGAPTCVDCLKRAAELNGELVEAHYCLSLAYTHLLGDDAQAISHARKAMAASPKDPRGPLALAYAARQANPNEARKAVRTALELDPYSAIAWSMEATKRLTGARDAGGTRGAKAALETAIEIDPHELSVIRCRAVMAVLDNRIDEAIAHEIEAIRKIESEERWMRGTLYLSQRSLCRMHFLKALSSAKNGDLKGAEASTSEAVLWGLRGYSDFLAESGGYGALYEQHVLMMYLKHRKVFQDALDRLANRAPGRRDQVNGYRAFMDGLVAQSTARMKGVIKQIESLRERSREDKLLAYFLATSYGKLMGMGGGSQVVNDRALLVFRWLHEQEPGNWEVVGNYATTLCNAGKIEDAQRLLLNATKMNPECPYFLVSLGQIYMQTGKRELAQKALQKAVAMGYDEGLGFVILATCYAMNEDGENLLKTCEQGLVRSGKLRHQDPNAEALRFMAACANFDMKKYSTARKHLAALLRLNPAASDRPEVKEMQRRLKTARF